jgi:heavy metal sensor kinase
VGRDAGPVLDGLTLFAGQLLAVGGGVLAVGLAGSWLIASQVVRPLRAISATAAKVSAANLSERIAGPLPSEVAELAGVLNETLDRLEEAFDRQVRFTADASHELRTPLAVLRSHAELALSRPRGPEEYRRALETCLRAAGRMTGVVESLLTLARADAGRLDLASDPVDLAAVAASAAELVQPLAEAKGVALSTVLSPAWVSGDADALGRAALNLLANAVQHNREGGTAVVRVGLEGEWAVLEVSDTGPGVAEADRPHLFERFYRADKARSRLSGGTGLGLAICRALAEAHGGTAEYRPGEGSGATFVLRLPVIAAVAE